MSKMSNVQDFPDDKVMIMVDSDLQIFPPVKRYD